MDMRRRTRQAVVSHLDRTLGVDFNRALAHAARAAGRRTTQPPPPWASGGRNELRLVPSPTCQIVNRRTVSVSTGVDTGRGDEISSRSTLGRNERRDLNANALDASAR